MIRNRNDIRTVTEVNFAARGVIWGPPVAGAVGGWARNPDLAVPRFPFTERAAVKSVEVCMRSPRLLCFSNHMLTMPTTSLAAKHTAPAHAPGAMRRAHAFTQYYVRGRQLPGERETHSQAWTPVHSKRCVSESQRVTDVGVSRVSQWCAVFAYIVAL